MRKVTVEMWLDEACFTKGALEMAINRTEQANKEWDEKHPGDPADMYIQSIEIYKRALESVESALKVKVGA